MANVSLWAQRFVIGLLFGTMLIRLALIATDWSFG